MFRIRCCNELSDIAGSELPGPIETLHHWVRNPFGGRRQGAAEMDRIEINDDPIPVIASGHPKSLRRFLGKRRGAQPNSNRQNSQVHQDGLGAMKGKSHWAIVRSFFIPGQITRVIVALMIAAVNRCATQCSNAHSEDWAVPLGLALFA